MKHIVESARNIDVIYEADVIVVGGGPAGIAAALASGRSGAKTALVERFGCLGGLQTQCFQVMFTFVDPEIHGGILQDILRGLEEGGATPKLTDLPAPTEAGLFQRLLAATQGKDSLPPRMFERAGYWWRWGREFDPEYYKFLLDNMMREAGVKLFYHTFAAGAIREENTLRGILIESKEGRKALLGKVVIDTSGEGDIAWKSGAPVLGDEPVPIGTHRGTHMGMLNAFYVGGVDQTKFEAFCKENPTEWGLPVNGRKMIQEGIKEGYHLRDGGIICFPKEGNRMWLMFAMYQVKDGRCWYIEDQTHAEIELRKQMWGLHKLLKDKVPGFEKSFVEKTPVIPGSGDMHRIIGDHILTIADMREGRAFDDAVGINNMIPDVYTVLGRLSFDILPHDIPYRCLISKEIDNLMAAGSTMSSGIFAMSGLRYCAPSMVQGQAAGTAAALAAKNDLSPKEVNIRTLQDCLRSQGARVSVKDLTPEVLAPYRAIRELSLLSGKPEYYDEIARY